jgi:ceramide glucosyltransferase
MWLFREAGAPYLFLHALWNPAIRWRNCEFRLRWGGKAEAVLMRSSAATASTKTTANDSSSLMSSAAVLSGKTGLDCCSGGDLQQSSPLPPSYGEAVGGGGRLLAAGC